MAAKTMDATKVLTFTLATTCTRVDYLAAVTPAAADPNSVPSKPAVTVAATPTFPVGSREIPEVIDLCAAVDLYIVSDGVTVDGGALPANYYLVKAGTQYAWHTTGKPILLAGASADIVTMRLR
jgi:hypothetical protein